MQHGMRDDVLKRGPNLHDANLHDPGQHDPWQIDPVTARIRTADTLRNPVIAVIEPLPSLSLALGEVCEFLHIAIATVAEPRDLPGLLHDMQPIAILHEAGAMDCALYDLLLVVAGYDPALPLLVVLPDDPQCRSALDAAQRLWELTDLVRYGRRPGIRELIDFMFHAGRKFGQARFMPI